MPIDPAVLRARAAAIAAQFSEPPAVLAAVRSLLEDYADRSHRASPRLAASAYSNAFKAPLPVVRAVVNALRAPVRASPQAALSLLNGLWAAGSREERRIAAELLGIAAPLAPAESLALVERWLPALESGDTAEALAEYGLGPLMRADPSTHLGNARRWVAHRHKWTRRFGLAALMPLVKDKAWDNVPAALDVLRGVVDDPDPGVRRAAAAVLERLIPKSRGEVSYFLREQARRSSNSMHSVIRTAMAKLPAEDQAEIIRALRA